MQYTLIYIHEIINQGVYQAKAKGSEKSMEVSHKISNTFSLGSKSHETKATTIEILRNHTFCPDN